MQRRRMALGGWVGTIEPVQCAAGPWPQAGSRAAGRTKPVPRPRAPTTTLRGCLAWARSERGVLLLGFMKPTGRPTSRRLPTTYTRNTLQSGRSPCNLPPSPSLLPADHAQEQADEIEALQSIFPDTFVSLSDTSFTIRVCSEESSEEGFNSTWRMGMRIDSFYPHAHQLPTTTTTTAAAITLKIAYTPSYPDEAPEIGLSDPQNVEESEVDEGKALLAEQAADNLGMVMVFTLQAALKEWLDTMSDKRKAEAEEVEKKKEEAKRKAEEEEVCWGRGLVGIVVAATVVALTHLRRLLKAKRLIGTPVTPETFKGGCFFFVFFFSGSFVTTVTSSCPQPGGASLRRNCRRKRPRRIRRPRRRRRRRAPAWA